MPPVIPDFIPPERWSVLLRKHIDKKEPITLVGHSHGGNVSIEAANIMARMAEFDGIPINILTINTPVRRDYQLSKKAAGRGHHVNVYDTSDPVQVCGGKVKIGIFQLGGVLGEMGPAGRKFKNARNIPVKHPQSLKGDYHNSHNRVWDWDTNKQ